MGEFLENLKKSVETGEFNSEAAKKIIEIDKLADSKAAAGAEEALNKRLELAGVKVATEQETLALNSAYEKKMEDIKKQDAVNKQLATLIEIEDMVKASVVDMLAFTEELETKFEKEFTEENPTFGDLYLKIQEVKNVFEPTLMEYKHKK